LVVVLSGFGGEIVKQVFCGVFKVAKQCCENDVAIKQVKRIADKQLREEL
jgi:hypothetical protein